MTVTLPPAVYVFGSGSFSSEAVHYLSALGIEIIGVVDYQPDRIGRLTPDRQLEVQNASTALGERPGAVILGIHNPSADLPEICQRLMLDGASAIYTPLQLWGVMRRHGIHAQGHYWLASTSVPQLPEPESEGSRAIDRARQHLADDESVRALDAVLGWWRSGDWSDSPRPRPMSEQYASSDVPLPRSAIHFVDLGAYTGDSLVNLTSHGFSFTRVTALEPDPVNFSELAARMRSLSLEGYALPLAASNRLEQLRFVGDAQGSSHVSTFGDAIVQAVPLDALLHGQSIDYVKMDVEGGELSVLEGMQSLIENQAPALAVCVYHRPSDLWEIPLWLIETQPRYTLFMRIYGHQGFDAVLYAIPDVVALP